MSIGATQPNFIENEIQAPPTHRIVKNSLWILSQTLFLNFISIFATGYIARTLGKESYGKFIFAAAFCSMFGPVVNLGLRSVTVREVAENRSQAPIFLGKMATLRLFLAIIAFLLTIWAINIMQYPMATKIIVYITAIGIIFNAITTTFKDGFQAFEKMKYIAYTEFFSGLILTILSVAVLFVGYRLIGLTSVYLFGSFLAMVLAIWFIVKYFFVPKPKLDLNFGVTNIKKGAPFFLPGIIGSVGGNVAMILLSKIGGDISVGIYGAASTLTSRLMVIEDSISNAYFPAMAAGFKESKEEGAKLFKRFFHYLLLIALPLAICGNILAKIIIGLIYGAKYAGSITVLQVLSWNLILSMLASFLSWTLAAIHQERKLSVVKLISTFAYIIFGILLIPRFKTMGMAYAVFLSTIVSFIASILFIKKFLLTKIIEPKVIMKILLANIAAGLTLLALFHVNIILSAFIYLALYISLILSLKLVSLKEVFNLKDLVLNRKIQYHHADR